MVGRGRMGVRVGRREVAVIPVGIIGMNVSPINQVLILGYNQGI